jgi:hypothetical protein
MNVLFLNHKISRCGVYWYGIRLYNIWKKSINNIFHYQELDCVDEYNNIIKSYDVIIYNYHCMTMPWLNNQILKKNIKNIGIWHEGPINIFFNKIIDVSSTIPRPIFETIPVSIENTNNKIIEFLNYSKEEVPIIGSFGFGFDSKGFDKIITLVCNSFDKAIIKLIITISEFGDKDGSIVKRINETCYNLVTNPNIEVKIINEFLSDNDILYFLGKNDINVFLYNTENNRGLSSVIDFAFSVNRPVCISDSYMFRNIYSENIAINYKSIKDCIKNDLDYIYKFRELNSHKNSINCIEKILIEI